MWPVAAAEAARTPSVAFFRLDNLTLHGDKMERSFWTDLALIVVTLGFYMPYWLWRRNQDLREALPEQDLPENAWWLAAGTAVTLLAPWLAFLLVGPLFMERYGFAFVALNVLAVLSFAMGILTLARNAEDAAELLALDWRIPAPLLAGAFAAAFLMVQAGILFESWTLRGLALILIAGQPLLFYQAYADLEDVESAALLRHRRQAPPPEPPPGTTTS